MNFLIIYLLIVNAVGFLVMSVDKLYARKNLWRVPERTLFLSAAMGGSMGVLIAMYLVRHKTKHMTFTIGIPLILTAQIGLAIRWFFR